MKSGARAVTPAAPIMRFAVNACTCTSQSVSCRDAVFPRRRRKATTVRLPPLRKHGIFEPSRCRREPGILSGHRGCQRQAGACAVLSDWSDKQYIHMNLKHLILTRLTGPAAGAQGSTGLRALPVLAPEAAGMSLPGAPGAPGADGRCAIRRSRSWRK